MLTLLLLPLALVGAWFLYLVLADEFASTEGMVPSERIRGMEQAQRISEVARQAEREMFEQALREANQANES